ncbi:hypothetical protein BH10PSE6_BH10PSE6_00960 [soil metagenome]
MAIKTGKQYIDSLRDGRRLYIDGKVVSDVTAYPPLQGVSDTIASLYDDQHNPTYRDVLTWRSPTTGEGGEQDLSRSANGRGVPGARRVLSSPCAAATSRPFGADNGRAAG